MGRSELAALEYQQAIQLKPDYAAPYAALSDFYRDKGAKQNYYEIALEKYKVRMADFYKEFNIALKRDPREGRVP